MLKWTFPPRLACWVLPEHLKQIGRVHLRISHLNLFVVIIEKDHIDAVDPAQVRVDSHVELPVEGEAVAADNNGTSDELVRIVGGVVTRIVQEAIGVGVDGRVIYRILCWRYMSATLVRVDGKPMIWN